MSESLKEYIDYLAQLQSLIEKGGGEKRIQNEHKKGKLTARERIIQLIDEGSSFEEFGLWAGYNMYESLGGCPAGGVITGLGLINGRKCVIVANDATVKAGAWFPITAKKNLRAQEISMENCLPIIYLVDSAGVFLPLQDEIFPDKEHFGRIFRNNARISAMGIPQIAAIMGSCVAGGAYLPIMSDEALIVEGTGSVFLAGSFLVKAAIGEEIDAETLGGATTHTEISGVTDYKVPDDKTALQTIRDIVAKIGPFPKLGFTREKPVKPATDSSELISIKPIDSGKPYDMMNVLNCIIDKGSFTEFKKGYGQTILTGYARIDGWNVGIVANQRLVVKAITGEMQIGGVIYNDSADKATRFILNCNQKRIPIVFFQDVTGFMVGKRSEHSGIIKDGAKMVNAVANSTVPKITIIVGNSYGAGNYAMCGKAYDPRFIYAWPSAKIAVMGGSQAANTLLQIEVATKEKKGEKVTDADKKVFLNKITQRYDSQTEVTYAAARLWVDEIIHPVDTRTRISSAIDSANHNPVLPEYKNGVIQV